MRALSLVLGSCVACGGAGDTGEGADTSRETIRGVRTCELNELIILDDMLGIRVYNDVGLHDCPDEWLAQIDADAYGVGGPRWRSVDQAVPLDDDALDAEPQEVPEGLGYQMQEAATVSLMALSVLEEKLGITIETVDDLPAAARSALLDATLRSTGYAVSEVSRGIPTELRYYAGQDIFVLDDGECRYAMKYYTSVYDAELVDEAAVATLGERLTHLPDGYSFSVQTLDEDLVIIEDEGLQYVMTDEFGNSYDRFACD